MRLIPAVLALSLLATGASAQAYQAAPVVKAEATSGSSASVSASMDVAAPPAAVFATLKDCAHATDFMPRLISCRILETGPGGQWEVREHRLKAGLFKSEMRNVFKIEFDAPRRIAFHRTGGDWKVSEGVWTFSPIDGGKGTHVAYQTRAAVNGPVPTSLMRSAIAKGMPEALLAIRGEAVRRAAKP